MSNGFGVGHRRIILDGNILRLVEGQLRVGFLRDGKRVLIQIHNRIASGDRANGVVRCEEQTVRAKACRELLIRIRRPDDEFAADDFVLVLADPF